MSDNDSHQSMASLINANNVETFIGRLGVKRLLPYGDDFLLVDWVCRTSDKIGEHKLDEMVGCYHIPIVENMPDYMLAHFPGNPIFAGALIVESASQVCLLCSLLNPAINSNGSRTNIRLAGLKEVKFRRALLPGDVLVTAVSLINYSLGVIKYSFNSYINNYPNGEIAAEGIIFGTQINNGR